MSVSARGPLPFLVLAGGLLSGCSSDGPSAPGVSRSAVVATYSANLYAAYSDSVLDEQAFQGDVRAFLAEPTEDTLATVRASWLASRAHYMLTEGARFYDGPIYLGLGALTYSVGWWLRFSLTGWRGIL